MAASARGLGQLGGAPWLDFFAGSGTAGEAAAKHGRGFVLIDESPEAVAIM
ncbi:MAG: RsmD family RNA methyltransferase [Sandaracinaceae bacterium]|nr:RsmD family RNA methyltransferase [Sandaracinaceae bacterium]